MSWLAACAALTVIGGGAAKATASEDLRPLDRNEKVAALRKALLAASPPASENSDRPVTKRLAQWLNWPNWGNWGNWNNWRNWGNWGNY